MNWKASLRSGVVAISIVAVAAPAGFAESPPAAERGFGPLAVSVAEAHDFSRIEFRWAGGARMTSRRRGQTLILHFARYAKPDMTRLRVDPPHWLKTAQDRNAGGLEITLTLADDADARVGQADGATYVNLFAKPAAQNAAAAAPAASADQTVPSSRPNPVPASGVVKLQAANAGGVVQLRFPWAAPLGAAVFRRGASIWIVFDAAAKLDLSGAPRGASQIQSIQAVQGADFSAVRIAAPADVGVSAAGDGAVWTISLGAGVTAKADPIKVTRDDAAASAALQAALAGATKVVWLNDPVVGDRIAVVTALAPAKGLAARREYVDLSLLPSAQGLAIEPIADDVAISTDGDLVSIGRPKGLALSSKSAAPVVADNGPDLPQPTTRPGLVDFDNWSRTGSGGFLARYDALQAAAADEVNQGKDAPVAARMGLARFLIGSELSYEAIGVLNMVARAKQTMLGDAEFRGLRGAAKAMAGRYKEAQTEFSAPVVADDPASSLWRGYADSKLGQWADARKEFAAGQAALFEFAPKWRGRFADADAEAAIALGQNPVADVEIDNALRGQDDPVEILAIRLTQAKLFEAEGQKDGALGVYQAISNVNLGYLSAPALLHATLIKLDEGKITPVQAADVLEGLRYRWRGDATELDTIHALGKIYLGLGRYREALEALRSAGQRLPDLPQAVEIQADLGAAFRNLFLDGQADGLQPIQALALFYDFKELTPIGADGDLMVRKLARRLVDVDLLGQAADLLKYQEENRLDGVPRAEVATDLATIDLMNRQPEAAIDALNESRTTLLPSALNAQRRVVEARAWLGLGQYDHALEIIQGDKGGDPDAIRAEIDWKKHDWAGAGAKFESLLADRWKTAAPLSADEEAKLLRAGVAYSLAGDNASLSRLRTRYQGFEAQARQPDALKVALAGMDEAQMAGADFNSAVAEDDTFVGWVQAMKQRFRDRMAAAGAGGGQG
jgi:tetratricopeptide (TPR) repeat protein